MGFSENQPLNQHSINFNRVQAACEAVVPCPSTDHDRTSRLQTAEGTFVHAGDGLMQTDSAVDPVLRLWRDLR